MRICPFNTDSGTSLKPSDIWTISLCEYHHREQHRIGELRFERKDSMDLVALAKEFAQRSPHLLKLARMWSLLAMMRHRAIAVAIMNAGRMSCRNSDRSRGTPSTKR